MIPVQVKEIAFDLSLSPVVLLLDESKQRVLPIWVGAFEAQAIAIALQGVLTPRPMTHDLIRAVCEHLGASLRQVIINDIREGTYYAEMYLLTPSGEIKVDSRPSDAIALALRTGAQLFISDKLAEYTLAVEELIDEQQQEELRHILGLTCPDELKKTLH